MRTWRAQPGLTALFSPIGLAPVDDITGQAPAGALKAYLDAKQADGRWRPTGVRPVVTPGGVLTFPALGRARAPLGQPPSRFRVRVEADHYIPHYRRDQDGFEFDCFPYNDSIPPQSVPPQPMPLVLVPAPGYPFPGHLMVLRGAVSDAVGAPVRDAEVSIGTTRRTLTDARGCFALSAPRPAAPGPIQIDAADLRTGRIGGATVQFPQDLGTNVQIVIT